MARRSWLRRALPLPLLSVSLALLLLLVLLLPASALAKREPASDGDTGEPDADNDETYDSVGGLLNQLVDGQLASIDQRRQGPKRFLYDNSNNMKLKDRMKGVIDHEDHDKKAHEEVLKRRREAFSKKVSKQSLKHDEQIVKRELKKKEALYAGEKAKLDKQMKELEAQHAAHKKKEDEVKQHNEGLVKRSIQEQTDKTQLVIHGANKESQHKTAEEARAKKTMEHRTKKELEELQKKGEEVKAKTVAEIARKKAAEEKRKDLRKKQEAAAKQRVVREQDAKLAADKRREQAFKNRLSGQERRAKVYARYYVTTVATGHMARTSYSVSQIVAPFRGATPGRHALCLNKRVPHLMYLNNRNTCGYRYRNLGYRFSVVWYMPRAAKMQFRAGVDWARGGIVLLDGKEVANLRRNSADSSWRTWWGHRINSWSVRKLTTRPRTLGEGRHTLYFIGFESCCDGTQLFQYRIGRGPWRSFDTNFAQHVRNIQPAWRY